MSASGLVYAAIVLMWAAVLIPMWLRRHDASTENRSAERFGQAMRVLSRREGSADRHEVVRPAPAREHPASVPSSTTRPVGSRPVTARRDRSPEARPAPSRSQARAALARRRARTLAVLGGLAVLSGLLSVLSVVPAWAPVPFVVLVVAFVVHLRLQARRAAQPRRRRPTGRPVGRSHGTPAADEPVRAERASAASRALVVQTKGAPAAATVAMGTSGPGRLGATADVAAQVDAEDPSWQPNPLPLPTYVTAPKAVRPIRVIDLTTPGAWTSGGLLEDDVPVVADTLAASAADAEELDALLEQDVALDASATERDRTPRRAVGD